MWLRFFFAGRIFSSSINCINNLPIPSFPPSSRMQWVICFLFLLSTQYSHLSFYFPSYPEPKAKYPSSKTSAVKYSKLPITGESEDHYMHIHRTGDEFRFSITIFLFLCSSVILVYIKGRRIVNVTQPVNMPLLIQWHVAGDETQSVWWPAIVCYT